MNTNNNSNINKSKQVPTSNKNLNNNNTDKLFGSNDDNNVLLNDNIEDDIFKIITSTSNLSQNNTTRTNTNNTKTNVKTPSNSKINKPKPVVKKPVMNNVTADDFFN